MMRKFNVVVNGQSFEVEVEEVSGGAVTPVALANFTAPVAPVPVLSATEPVAKSKAKGGAGEIVSPLPGKVLRVLVKANQSVKAGDVLLVIEAMKMENEIVAPTDGVIKEINVAEGATVETGDLLVSM